jgi:hypothetical protein
MRLVKSVKAKCHKRMLSKAFKGLKYHYGSLQTLRQLAFTAAAFRYLSLKRKVIAILKK